MFQPHNYAFVPKNRFSNSGYEFTFQYYTWMLYQDEILQIEVATHDWKQTKRMAFVRNTFNQHRVLLVWHMVCVGTPVSRITYHEAEK